MVKFCDLLRTSSSKTSVETYMLFLKKIYSRNIACFVVDSSRLHLTFVAFCLLSIIRKQQIKKYNYYVGQTDLLTRFRTDFTSLVWNFCRSLSRRRSS